MSKVIIVNIINQVKNKIAAVQIQALKEKILSICKQLEIIAPDALWMIVWREYGVQERPGNQALSAESKNLFKTTFSNVANLYPKQLVIIAGTISSYKQYNDINKLYELEDLYKAYRWIDVIEKRSENPFEHQIAMELAKIQLYKIRQTPFTVFRNTCYIFFGQLIWAHDKLSGKYEHHHNKDIPNGIFQPAKERNLPHVFSVMHPSTEEQIFFCVDICRDII